MTDRASMAGEPALDRGRRGAFGLVVVAAFGCASGPTPRYRVNGP